MAVLRRELLTGLRRGTPFTLLAANAIVMALLAVVVAALAASISPWVAPTVGATSAPSQSGLGPTLIAWRGPTLFWILCSWLAILTTIVGPMFGARALTSERAAGTLDDLFVSGVPFRTVIIAKAIAAYSHVVILLIASIPGFAISWVFGGVGVRVTLYATILLFIWAAFVVVLGMLAASIHSGSLAATALACCTATALLLGATIGFIVASLAGQKEAASVLGLLSPLIALLTSNAEFAEVLARNMPGSLTLPINPSTMILGKSLGVPMPILSSFLFLAALLAIIPLVAAIVDPYHSLKTMHLRQPARGG